MEGRGLAYDEEEWVGGCCRRGNEPLGCINMSGIYLLAEELSASQVGLCYVQLAAVGMLCCEVATVRCQRSAVRCQRSAVRCL